MGLLAWPSARVSVYITYCNVGKLFPKHPNMYLLYYLLASVLFSCLLAALLVGRTARLAYKRGYASGKEKGRENASCFSHLCGYTRGYLACRINYTGSIFADAQPLPPAK